MKNAKSKRPDSVFCLGLLLASVYSHSVVVAEKANGYVSR